MSDSPPGSRGLLSIVLLSSLVPGDAVAGLEVEGVAAISVLGAVVLQDGDGSLVGVGHHHGHQTRVLQGRSTRKQRDTSDFE